MSGTKIAIRIAELGYKKGEVAAKAEITRGTLTLIIKGESLPSLPVAIRLARVLGTTVEELWGDVADKK